MAAPGYKLKNRTTTSGRIANVTADGMWNDVNLYGVLYPNTAPVTSITHYAAPGRIPYDEAIQGTYVPTSVGSSFGPTWSTHWFHVIVDVPSAWDGERVLFFWQSGCEAMIWINGVPRQGFNGTNSRDYYILTKNKLPGESQYDFYVEMACNRLFGAGTGPDILPPNPDLYFTLSRCDIATHDMDAYQLYTDFEVLENFASTMGDNSNRGTVALYTADDMVNITTRGDASSYATAHGMAQAFFDTTNGQGQHKTYAVGNCHIDSAWLWPYAETVRKVARSWSSTMRLLENYPDFIFVASQAQQHQWAKDNYPELFSEMKSMVTAGRFLPVGSVWTEMDGNLPSGESFVRQFLTGQRFFQQEYGYTCKEFWLPDTFGYSAQIPQIMRMFNLNRFVTQKLSWNLVNKFPNNTFRWAGIDGTTVLSHFPPGDSYVMQCKPDEVKRTLDNFKDKGRSNSSLFLYGFGDGGQGPTQDMIERARRMADVDGLPKVDFGSPDQFFDDIEANSTNLVDWRGELYLELHNASYTTQAKIKAGNRSSEILMHDVEGWGALAVARGGTYSYPSTELLRLWKLILLNQFHDVLPGTCIEEAVNDALAYYDDVSTSGNTLLTGAIQGFFDTLGSSSSTNTYTAVLNLMGFGRIEVISVPDAVAKKIPEDRKQKAKKLATDKSDAAATLMMVSVPAFGYSQLADIPTYSNPVTVTQDAGNITIGNGLVQAVVDSVGRITSLTIPGDSREGIESGRLGNQFAIFDDVPLYWDAWDVMDYHLQTYKALTETITTATVVETGPLRGSIQVVVKISDSSTITQDIILLADSHYIKFQTQVDWNESHKFLKVEFPINASAQQATYEIQFGHLQRPTHFNTSWDWAKYEVAGHKWADYSEFDWGVSILNDSKYGWSCIGNVLRLSLLRSSKNPDGNADMGIQNFTYAVMPHKGTFQSAGVIQYAYELNHPLRLADVQVSQDHATPEESYISLSTNAVMLETVKKAEDSSNVILRLYECHGGQADATVTINLPVTNAFLCDGYEAIQGNPLTINNGSITLSFKPFQIISVVLTF